MRKITIICGGTGSNNLTKALVRRGYHVNKLLNLYDDGKSTGVLRRALDTLGPSDLRKAFVSLLDDSPLADKVRQIFETRADYGSREDFLAGMLVAISDMKKDRELSQLSQLAGWLDSFVAQFSNSSKSLESYRDMSLGNCIMVGCWLSSYSWQQVADELSALLCCRGEMTINSEEVLWLGGVDANGVVALDEAAVVETKRNTRILQYWLRPSRTSNQSLLPVMTERAIRSITNCDVLIFPSGTYFSSLIPTFDSIGFREAVETASVDPDFKKVWISNLVEDRDMIGVPAYELFQEVTNRLSPDSRNFDLCVCGDTLPLGDWPEKTKSSAGFVVASLGLVAKNGESHDGEKLVDILEQHLGDF